MPDPIHILEAVIKARAVIRAGAHHDGRPHWAGVSCPSCGTDYRSVSAVDGETRQAKLTPGRIHKAGSAEAILRHCLRQLGWTAAYKRGQLTGAQHVQLLEEIRQYGRAWLRHEAEQFVRQYLVNNRGMGRSVVRPIDVRGASSDLEQTRELMWEPGPGGFLIAKDTGFRANIGRFFRRAKQFVREVIVAGAMSILGPAPLTGEELDAAEQEAQKQEQWFDKFHQEVLQAPPAERQPVPPGHEPILLPPPTPKEFVARVELYANPAWQAPQRINRATAIKQGVFKLERRVLGEPKTHHCGDCPPLAAQGWVPIGTLPAIGETECGPLCLCHFRFKVGLGSGEYFQGKKGPVPAPSEVQMIDEEEGVHMIAEPPGKKLIVPIAGPPK